MLIFVVRIEGISDKRYFHLAIHRGREICLRKPALPVTHKMMGQSRRCAKSHSFSSLAGSTLHFKIKMIKTE